MANGTTLVCPQSLTWLYAGVNISLTGNGGPECANYLSPTHRIIETALILLASIIEIAWAINRIEYSQRSSVCPVAIKPATAKSCNGDTGKHVFVHSNSNRYDLIFN